MPLCDDVVPPVNVDSLSLRLKFGKRNGTAASWLCNVINSIIFLCHMLYYCACWDAAALSLITFLLPVAFDFASLVCMYLAPHHPPWVTVPTFCIAELHGFFWMFHVYAVSFHYSPPPTGGVRDQLQHTQLTVLLMNIKAALNAAPLS